MRVTVRLSRDTLRGMKRLQQIYEEEFNGLKVNLGYVVFKAYKENKDSDWEYIKNAPFKLKNLDINEQNEQERAKGRTTLDLKEEVREGIKEMQKKENLPYKFGVKRVTTGYCIKLIVKAALLKIEENPDE